MNTNCLEGIKCPKCGSEGPFVVEVTTQVMLHDEGSEDYNSDVRWDGDSYIRCVECDHDGQAKEFRIHDKTEEN